MDHSLEGIWRAGDGSSSAARRAQGTRTFESFCKAGAAFKRLGTRHNGPLSRAEVPLRTARHRLRLYNVLCVHLWRATLSPSTCIRFTWILHATPMPRRRARLPALPYAIAATACSTPSPRRRARSVRVTPRRRAAGDRYFFDGKAGYAWSPAHYDEQGNTTLEFEGMVIWSYFGLGVQLMRASFDDNLDRLEARGSRRISASRGAAAVRGGRATSFPGMTAVGGFFFDFGPIRTRRGVPRGARPWRGEERCWSGPERCGGCLRRCRRGAGVWMRWRPLWVTAAPTGSREGPSGVLRWRTAPGRVRRCVNRARHARRRGSGPGCDLEAWRVSRRRRGHVVLIKVVCVRGTAGLFRRRRRAFRRIWACCLHAHFRPG